MPWLNAVTEDCGSAIIETHKIAARAYSGPIRPPILIEIGHPFWFKPATDSGAKRPPIPEDPATLSGGLATRDNPA
ncbi:MAG: hypothetical protein EOM91_18340 [Sphingobacteriia bacterium]|nr:hypothetical protein [Sphingobacteriia bacterium]NCC40812.1 hypothetical protein [Gammaproteobacteria bacterium]